MISDSAPLWNCVFNVCLLNFNTNLAGTVDEQTSCMLEGVGPLPTQAQVHVPPVSLLAPHAAVEQSTDIHPGN